MSKTITFDFPRSEAPDFDQAVGGHSEKDISQINSFHNQRPAVEMSVVACAAVEMKYLNAVFYFFHFHFWSNRISKYYNLTSDQEKWFRKACSHIQFFLTTHILQ